MAITLPLDFLDDFPGWSTEFDLLYRQEQSRTAGGVTYVKDFGSPLWAGTWQSRSLTPNELDYWRSRLKVLDNGLNQFVARPMSRYYPIAYPRGTGMGNVTAAAVNSIGANRDAVSIKGLPTGYKVSIGDYVQIGSYNLHQLQEAGTGATTAAMTMRPHAWPVSAANDAVKVVKPSCLMTMVSGSLTTSADPKTGEGVVSFQGVESR